MAIHSYGRIGVHQEGLHNFAKSQGGDENGFFDEIGSGVSHLAHSVGTFIENAADTAKKGITTFYQDEKGLTNKIVDNTIGQHGIIQNTVGDIKSIISTPLLLIAGGVAFFLLYSGRNSSFTGTANITR